MIFDCNGETFDMRSVCRIGKIEKCPDDTTFYAIYFDSGLEIVIYDKKNQFVEKYNKAVMSREEFVKQWKQARFLVNVEGNCKCGN